jgi:hypothetical protein
MELHSHLTDAELQIDASCNDWIKVIHNGRSKVTTLSASTSLNLGTFEVAETLAATFDISDDVEIVGLTAVATLTEEEAQFKHHGEIVVPLSFVASGQLKQIIASGTEAIPAFNLVIKKFGSFDGLCEGIEADFSDGSAATGLGEETEYTDAFIDLMENSDAFNSVEKNVLLRLGIDEAMSGNILYRAAFRVA